jgi:hypothetical protein
MAELHPAPCWGLGLLSGSGAEPWHLPSGHWPPARCAQGQGSAQPRNSALLEPASGIRAWPHGDARCLDRWPYPCWGGTCRGRIEPLTLDRANDWLVRLRWDGSARCGAVACALYRSWWNACDWLLRMSDGGVWCLTVWLLGTLRVLQGCFGIVPNVIKGKRWCRRPMKFVRTPCSWPPVWYRGDPSQGAICQSIGRGVET